MIKVKKSFPKQNFFLNEAKNKFANTGNLPGNEII